MTDLQKVEKEMLCAVIRICEQLNLTYYLVCGSALGAMYYQGFIPWDDDLDVALPRPDYQRFCEQAPALLPDHYFLQTYQTDPAFPAMYGKIRDSRTTFIETAAAHLPIHHGIYLDVFPLDGYPTDKRRIKKLERRKKWLKLQLASAYPSTPAQKITTRGLLWLFRRLGVPGRTDRVARRLEKLVSRWDVATSPIWCNHGNWQGRLEYAPREQYGQGREATFEGLTVRVPALAEEYLTQKYGNWQRDLPVEQQVSHHTYLVCDTEKPYIEYV